MKKVLIFVISIMLLVTGCTPTSPASAEPITPPDAVEETPAPELTPMPTATPTYAELIAEEYGFHDKYAAPERFVKASPSTMDDWSVNPDVWDYMYEFPYNIDVIMSEYAPVATTSYVTNKEVLEKVSSDIIEEVIEVARQYNLYEHSCDYMNADGYVALAEEVLPPTEEVKESIAEGRRRLLNGHYVHITEFLSDPSLVYIDYNGFMRVRGIMFFCALKENEGEDRVKNTWYYSESEYVIAPTAEVAKANGCAVWTDKPFAIMHEVDLSDGKMFVADEEALDYLRDMAGIEPVFAAIGETASSLSE